MITTPDTITGTLTPEDIKHIRQCNGAIVWRHDPEKPQFQQGSIRLAWTATFRSKEITGDELIYCPSRIETYDYSKPANEREDTSQIAGSYVEHFGYISPLHLLRAGDRLSLKWSRSNPALFSPESTFARAGFVWDHLFLEVMRGEKRIQLNVGEYVGPADHMRLTYTNAEKHTFTDSPRYHNIS